jgi:hypothetical protein
MSRLFTLSATLFLYIAAFLLFETPVSANAPIFWQGILGSAPALLLNTKAMVVAFILVVLIEAWVFDRAYKLGWKRSLIIALVLNLVSSALGFVVGTLSFSEMYMAGPLVLVAILLAPIFSFAIPGFRKLPVWFGGTAIICVIVGFLGLYADYGSEPPQPGLAVLGLMLSPLPFGFGLTLLFEGFMLGWFIKDKGRWGVLMRANIYSYILLALMIPFFGQNPFQALGPGEQSFQYEKSIRRMMMAGASAQEIVDMLERPRASNLYLLGLVKNMPVPDNYDVSMEFDALLWTFSRFVPQEPVDLSTGAKVADLFLKYPSLKAESRADMEWLKQYFSCWIAARKAIQEHDADSLAKICEEWDQLSKQKKLEIPPLQLLYYELSASKSDLMPPCLQDAMSGT